MACFANHREAQEMKQAAQLLDVLGEDFVKGLDQLLSLPEDTLNPDDARKIATHLLSERLGAIANEVAPVESQARPTPPAQTQPNRAVRQAYPQPYPEADYEVALDDHHDHRSSISSQGMPASSSESTSSDSSVGYSTPAPAHTSTNKHPSRSTAAPSPQKNQAAEGGKQKKRTQAYDPTKLFVGNFPPCLTDTKIRRALAHLEGLLDVRVLLRSSVSGCRCAFLKFSDEACARTAKDQLDGCLMFPSLVPFALSARIAGRAPVGSDSQPAPTAADKKQPGTKLFISNLPSQTTDESLRQIMAPYPGLVDAFVFRQGPSTCGRSGVVRFGSIIGASHAQRELNGLMVGGSPLQVRVAVH